MKPHARPALLCFGALAALCLTAACGSQVTAPDEPAALLAPVGPAHATAYADGTMTESDSVHAGYGNPSTGGLDYEAFEYDPDTGTEPVVTSDPEAEKGSTTSTSTTEAP